jgi:hypothetical protein
MLTVRFNVVGGDRWDLERQAGARLRDFGVSVDERNVLQGGRFEMVAHPLRESSNGEVVIWEGSVTWTDESPSVYAEGHGQR